MRISSLKTLMLPALAAGALLTAVAASPSQAQAQPYGWGHHRGWGHHYGWRGGPRLHGPRWGYYGGPRCVVRWRWAPTPYGWRRVPVRRCW